MRSPQPALVSPREVVNFDFAWRFSHALEPRVRECEFEQGVNYGEGYIWQGVTASYQECCNECANRQTCLAWDWSDSDRTCFVKDNAAAKKIEQGRWSGRLAAPWPVNDSTPAQAQHDFNDSAWEIVDTPHDYGRDRELRCLQGGRRRRSLLQDADFASDGPVTFDHNCSGWYRKSFFLPAAWSAGVTWVYVEAAYKNAVVFLNGRRLMLHLNGYTSFAVALDAATGAIFSDGRGRADRNVLAIFTNAAPGTGYWYQGGGLFRHQHLVHVPATVHMPPDGAWAHANVSTAAGSISPNGALPKDGLSAAAGSVALSAAGVLSNADATTEASTSNVSVSARFISQADGAVLGNATSGDLTLAPGAELPFTLRVTPRAAVQLWSVARPYLYVAELAVSVAGTVVDAQNITFGARHVALDATTGFKLNGQPVKMRGFCDHSTFGGVGAAVPDRVNLYRAQGLRATGGNSWRMAHNPPVPVRLDMMDRLGMLALDENHYYDEGTRPYGQYDPETRAQTFADMAALVRRDRSHPSVWSWNLCNEVNCDDSVEAVAGMRNVTDTFDGTRPITMNHLVSDALPYLDIQGMSHRVGTTMDRWHAQHPATPAFASEAVLCESERGVDYDFCPKPTGPRGDFAAATPDDCQFNDEVSNCTSKQLGYSDSRPFMGGTLVWSGWDYGSGDPVLARADATGMVGDRAGFEKPIRWWLRAHWLANVSRADAGRPVLWPGAGDDACGDAPTLHIVERWEAPPMAPPATRRSGGGSATRTIHVYTNAPAARLWVNGAPVVVGGGATAVAQLDGVARFAAVAFAPGNLTAEALTSDAEPAQRLATSTVLTAGASGAAALRLSLDAPSPRSGTGSALVADGQDVAMVRCEIVDDRGRIVSPRHATANLTVTFSVASGGGRVVGTSSGDPRNAPNVTAPRVAAHAGLARAFVISSEVRVGSAAQRRRLAEIHADAPTAITTSGSGANVRAATIVLGAAGVVGAPPPIIVRAEAAGVPPAILSIPLTTDEAALPLAVASALGE